MTVCPFAAWKPVQNHGGRMSAQLGLVLHVQEGNNSLAGWFNNPAAGASSTFWVSKAGALEQYVDSNVTAWAQGNGNSTYQSVETEGYHSEPLTAAQESMLARLYSWGASTFAWANALAETPGQKGFAWHGMGGSSWGGHTGCPGDLRKPRRGPILAVAFGSPAPSPGPTGFGNGAQEDDKMAICSHPNGKRIDLVCVGVPTGNVWHYWTGDDANLAAMNKENLGGSAIAASACWLDANRLQIVVDGGNGRAYSKLFDGTRWQPEWAPIPDLGLPLPS